MSRNDVPGVAQGYGFIATHTRCGAFVLVFVVFCVHMYSFAGLIRRTPPPTLSDTAITDRHSDTTFFQLRAHWVRISWSTDRKIVRTCAPGGSRILDFPACKESTLSTRPGSPLSLRDTRQIEMYHYTYHISLVITQTFFHPKQSQRSRSILYDRFRSLRLFKKGTTLIIVKFDGTVLVICSLCREKKNLSYGGINKIVLILKQKQKMKFLNFHNKCALFSDLGFHRFHR